MCVWENSSAASKEKNSIPIFNISQLSNTTLHIYRVFINTSVVTVRNFKNTYIPKFSPSIALTFCNLSYL